MPAIDMPLEQLKTYQGTNPKPADFDAFWDRSLKELNAIDPKVELTPAPFFSSIADAYHLTFTSTKGARIYAKLLKPKHINEKAPAILLFHGLSGASRDWMSMLSYVAEGFVVAALDTRGQGGFSEDVGGVRGTSYTTPFMRGFDGKPEDLLCRDLFLDTAKLAHVVMAFDDVDETRVAAHGSSQGGGLSIACAALVPEIALCVPLLPYMSDYMRVWNMDLDVGAYEGIRYYLRAFDPLREHIDEFFKKLGYIDIQHLASRIRAKVLMGTGLMDNTCPPSTQFAAYNKMNTEKSILIYPDFGHEMITGLDDIVFAFLCELKK